MPIMDGLGVLKEIKSRDRNVDVIIMTGHSDEATAVRCLKHGAYDYFHKPLEDIEILLTAVRRVLEKRALEFKNQSLIKQLEELSIKDSLTQVYNYRYLQVILDDEINRCERYGHSFFMLMIDADHFKKINDSFGHLFGDQVLRELCEIVSQELRSTDRLFRYGGEEFIVIMNEITETEISKAVERLQSTIRNHVFRYEKMESKITVSMGGAIFPDDAKDKINLIRIADQMLYKAKNSGRDRFECSSFQSLTDTFDNNVEKLPDTNLAAK
jgi:diguanylate cyclase (GGDEF)-like protein